jgi:hypothetical protein
MASRDDRPKYYQFPISFKTEEDMEAFKNYVHGVKEGRAVPIYQTVTEMMELHKEKYRRK